MRLIASCFIASCLALPVQAASVDITVDHKVKHPPIAPEIYGQFAEHLGYGIYDGIWVGPESDIPNVRGIRSDVVDALKDIEVPVVRWPGGCFADEYHWRDGIGPRRERPVRKNNWWGGVEETNAFGTHEFFDFAEEIGAKTYLSVNVASSTPTEMREWIEYLTSDNQDDLANERRANGRDQPFQLDYVGIGNESWGCGGAMRPEYYSDLYRRWAAFFHKNGGGFHNNNDNKAVRVASGANNLDTNWTYVVTKNAGPMMDAISLHFYTLNQGNWPSRNELTATQIDQQAWHEIVFQANRMDEVLLAHEGVLDANDPDKRIALYVDEWGTWYRPEPGHESSFLLQQNTLRDAVTAALTLNIFHNHTERVKMANIAQAVNVLQAMLLTDGPAMAKTPTYHVFHMYKDFQGATPVGLAFESPRITHGDNSYPAISASAATTQEGTMLIGLVNADPVNGHEVTFDLGVRGKLLGAKVLTHDKMNAHNVPGQPADVEPAAFTNAKMKGSQLIVDMPSKSVVVLRLAI